MATAVATYQKTQEEQEKIRLKAEEEEKREAKNKKS
jgi:hypothetical protein